MLDPAVSVFVDPVVSNIVIIILQVNSCTIKICYIQDVIKVGGVVTAVILAQLHVLIDIVILVLVTVCGDVIQTTV
jgi:hypothetical protein